ncbi:hypothetical protein TrLO_g10125 [Triparma laevis f. longispina]|uniref:Uncharacterized protein n=1 Tax=Triparma laevis f. longispina TaxID=1714387 RepID=A0A9W7ADP4_9STRA|nr:hypothetical protein TrLO_g10125 [Triparma laevis f. longispina]
MEECWPRGAAVGRLAPLQISTRPARWFGSLGSGVGLPNATVLDYYAKFKDRISFRASDGHEAFITTGEGEAGILFRNLEKYEQNAKAIPLLWGKTEDVFNALPSYDVLFAAGLLQWPAVVEPLAMTVHALLHPGKGAEPKIYVNQETNEVVYEKPKKK